MCWETEWLLTTQSPHRAIAFVMFLLIYLITHLHGAYFMPGTLLSTLQVLTQSHHSLRSFCPHIIDEDTGGTERLSDLPEVTQLIVVRWRQDLYLSHLAPESVPLATESDCYGNSLVMKHLRNYMSYLYRRKCVSVLAYHEFGCQWLNCPDL